MLSRSHHLPEFYLVIPKQEIGAPLTLNNGSTSLSTGNLPSAPSNLADPRNAQLQHSRSVSDTIFPTNTGNPNSNIGNQAMGSPAMIQMQKMVEQQRLRAGTVAGSQMGGFSGQNINPAAVRQDGVMGYPPIAGPSQPLSQPEQPTPASKVIVWKGSLIWSGIAPTGKKELRTVVYATTTNAADWYVFFIPFLMDYSKYLFIYLAILIHGLRI